MSPRKLRILSTFISLVVLCIFTIKLLNFELIYYKPEKLATNYNSFQRTFVNIDDISPIDRKNYPFVTNLERKDWQDIDFIQYELSRKGPGERGQTVVLTDKTEILQNQKKLAREGLSVLISEKISVNRSLPDTRPSR